METERATGLEPGLRTGRDTDHLVGNTGYVTTGAPIQTGENVLPARNRVQWGPIVAGVVGALATFLLMTVLGIALGASVLEPADTAGDIGTWAAVWGAISAILAFFVGGWLAAKTAAVDGPFAGLVNGLMAGAAGLLLILWLSANGLGNLFGTISSNVGEIANLGQDVAQSQGVTPQEAQGEAATQAADAQAQAEQAVTQADNPETFERVRNSAFGTFLGLLLPLIAAALGGYLGHNKRAELIHGTSAG
jgi:hypothetical protein